MRDETDLREHNELNKISERKAKRFVRDKDGEERWVASGSEKGEEGIRIIGSDKGKVGKT